MAARGLVPKIYSWDLPQQQSFMEQPQQDEPLFLLRMDETTARATKAVMTIIDMMVAAFIVRLERLNIQTKKRPRR